MLFNGYFVTGVTMTSRYTVKLMLIKVLRRLCDPGYIDSTFRFHNFTLNYPPGLDPVIDL